MNEGEDPEIYTTWFTHKLRSYIVEFRVVDGAPVLYSVYKLTTNEVRLSEYSELRLIAHDFPNRTYDAFEKAFNDWMTPQIVAERLTNASS